MLNLKFKKLIFKIMSTSLKLDNEENPGSKCGFYRPFSPVAAAFQPSTAADTTSLYSPVFFSRSDTPVLCPSTSKPCSLPTA